MSEDEEKYHSKRGFFAWFDRILFLLIILTHFAAVFEFVREKIEKRVTPEFALMGYIILVTLFWTIFISAFSWRQVKEAVTLQQYKGYVFAYKWFNLAFSLVHQMQREFAEIPPGDPINEDKLAIVVNHFEEICLHVATAFRTITGKEISVCIKIVNGKDISRDSSVKTFVRDAANVDRNYDENFSTHIIESNTAFSHIIKQIGRGKGKGGDGRCFFCNDLRQLRNYKNSSYQFYNQEPWNDNLSRRQRNKKWNMPYKSTIVTGVFPNLKQYYKDQFIIGFLCIDSDEPNVFHESRDCAILTGIADGVYNSLKTFDLFTRSTIE
jgi:hypothetical protein